MDDAVEADEANDPMNALHLDVIVSCCAIDFRDAQHLAMACTASRNAIARGPLCLVTDICRIITHDDIERLFELLRWCGAAVRVLRLDQQPSYLWAPELVGSERAATWHRVMSKMPNPSSVILHAIGQHCPNLEELAMHGWVAFNGCDVQWDTSVVHELCRMPRLRRVHLPTSASRSAVNKRMALEMVLESCTELTQLDVALSFPCNVMRVLTGRHASRLTQLSLDCIGADELSRLAGACSQLCRLHLHDCDLDGLDLSSALPAGLAVLTMVQCEGAVAPNPFERAHSHFGRLQMLSFDRPILPEGPAGPSLLRAVCTQPSLLVLDVSFLEQMNDALLLLLAAQCSFLHTLHMPNCAVTAAGFETVRCEPALLPRLRVITYWNDSYERGFDDFFSKTPGELAAELEADLIELDEGDWTCDLYDLKPSASTVRTFYAFCALVVERRLIVPSERHTMHVLPWHAQELSRDYLCLRSW